jgi:ElaB/YqjD/DUF883 family membrane-anchored ribosome-binding protein
MSKNTREVTDHVNALAEDARALVAATAHVAEDQVVQARQRLADVLERGQNVYGRVRDEAVAEARATDRALHEHPYQAIGIAFGVGVLFGCLAACRRSCNGAGSRAGAGP